MSSRAVIMSIKPEYAQSILAGTKTVELRRVVPRGLQEGDLVLIYASAPVKALLGAFKVGEVTKRRLPDLWRSVRGRCGITKTEFDAYYEGTDQGVCIPIAEVWRMEIPIKLGELRRSARGFHPPQSFRYATDRELARAVTGMGDRGLALPLAGGGSQSRSTARSGTVR